MFFKIEGHNIKLRACELNIKIWNFFFSGFTSFGFAASKASFATMNKANINRNIWHLSGLLTPGHYKLDLRSIFILFYSFHFSGFPFSKTRHFQERSSFSLPPLPQGRQFTSSHVPPPHPENPNKFIILEVKKM